MLYHIQFTDYIDYTRSIFAEETAKHDSWSIEFNGHTAERVTKESLYNFFDETFSSDKFAGARAEFYDGVIKVYVVFKKDIGSLTPEILYHAAAHHEGCAGC